MEACLASDEVAVGGEGGAALGGDGVEVGAGREGLVDDGFVEVTPQRPGGLQFCGMGGARDKKTVQWTVFPENGG